MLHILKLAVGITDPTHLQRVQAERLTTNPPLRHWTRSFPRRVPEILDGGSMYWVIAGAILVRQRILDVVADTWDDGSACAAIVLDPDLVPVRGRPTRPFQGWRYLQPAEAPEDIAHQSLDTTNLPPALAAELRTLCLL